MDKVSVVIPCYNQGEYLEECLTSVIEQTYPNIEIIVVDDGSRDNNTKILLNKISLNNKNIKVISIENSGVCKARNVGISNSSGKYILPLDADDKISKTFIEECINIFNTNDRVDIVYTLGKAFGYKSGVAVFSEYSSKKIIKGNVVFCTALYKKEDYHLVNGYNSNMIYGYEDWDFWLSMTEKEKVFHRINKVLFYYRIKEKSRNADIANNELQEKLMIKQIYLNHKMLYEKFNMTFDDLISEFNNSKNFSIINKIKYILEKVKIYTKISINKAIN